MTTLGKRLRSARKVADLTQRAVAERAGMSANYVAQIERNEANPRDAAILALAVVLGVRPQWLASGEEPRVGIPPSQLTTATAGIFEWTPQVIPGDTLQSGIASAEQQLPPAPAAFNPDLDATELELIAQQLEGDAALAFRKVLAELRDCAELRASVAKSRARQLAELAARPDPQPATPSAPTVSDGKAPRKGARKPRGKKSR